MIWIIVYRTIILYNPDQLISIQKRSFFILAFRYEHGDGVDENREISYQLYEKAAMTGNAEAQWRYAYVTAYWKGDRDKARIWYEKSVAQGNDEAKRLLKAINEGK